ncbi:ParB/RepB/Spo0J family partition protein [Campylobacter troglodytis]|uniref:ParB/RepB/Spo0J family partition protein n=1 Tax=Campylobacter troglodytis TaxID=654363 RepID=UPI00115B359A|nr:ParB/RepB/Spo0J family partition protein [Campylobacter troglodytis]TQR61388.1 chromosome partitioning protein ParB [Campylobacter troglodytis]
MAKRRALGRGLESLLGEAAEAYSKDLGIGVSDVQNIDIDLITPNPYQPRKSFDEEALSELAASIEEFGLIQPVVLYKQNDGNFVLIAGERRLRACKMLGNTDIKAVILDANEERLRELALIENIQREDLNPIELAHSYKQIIDAQNLTQEALARYIHKSRPQITNTLRLLELDESTQELIMNGKLSQGHAKMLVGLDKNDQKMVLDTILGQKLNVRDTERLIQRVKRDEDATEIQDENLQKELEKLKKRLNKLDISYKIKKAQITLSLSDVDKIKQLNNLLQ